MLGEVLFLGSAGVSAYVASLKQSNLSMYSAIFATIFFGAYGILPFITRISATTLKAWIVMTVLCSSALFASAYYSPKPLQYYEIGSGLSGLLAMTFLFYKL